MNIDYITRLSFRLAWRYKTISIKKMILKTMRLEICYLAKVQYFLLQSCKICYLSSLKKNTKSGSNALCINSIYLRQIIQKHVCEI